METLLIAAIIFAFLWIAGTIEDRKKKKTTYNKVRKPQVPPKVSTYYYIDEQFIRSHKKDYLQSRKWKMITKLIRTRDSVCQVCGATHSLEVHHITYERFMHEDLSDLVLLCGNRYDENGEYIEGCHQKLHNAAKKLYKDFSYEYKYPLELLEESSK